MFGYLAMGLSVAFTGVSASIAQQSGVETRTNAGISLVVPTGRILVDPGTLNGEPIYVRKTKAKEGMAIVEVSTTPFEPILASGTVPPALRPDQPASW